MAVISLADSAARQIENLTAGVSEALFEPTIRLGVTGLARAGKTVFITSLVANLLSRGRMLQLAAEREGRIEAAFLQPQPDDTVPRFNYEEHLADMTGPDPRWPDSTRAISELRLSLKVRPSGFLSGLNGSRRIHLDIVDYPGEWLLDLALLERSYAEWCADLLARMKARPAAQDVLAAIHGVDPLADHDEPTAQNLTAAYTAYLHQARADGFADCTPGRFLLPGDLAGSPVLTFVPLPQSSQRGGRRSLYREMERRYDAYKAKVVKPFFTEHFARIDRQVILADVLGAIHSGPAAVEDMRLAMSNILSAFRPGKNGFLTRVLGAKRVEKILFAATKADHLHHQQHPQLSAIVEALMQDARDKAQFAGAETAALSLASLRATTEEMRSHDGADLPCVRGTLLDSGRQTALYPGALPENPADLLTPARQGAEDWLNGGYHSMRFAPAPSTLRAGDGPPHIRLDRAAEFLIGDRL